ncbi:hypothetical protein GCM10009850_102920 [Nonomuraea monospora]|uniref:Pentapeptide repeat-containing protein n=1 Tax=Nonomuraea monospora TaxID=568818 RepID=A0ABP5PT06_9ACTN
MLIGPAARRLAGEQHPLTQAERQQMTATERVEAVNAARHTLIQAATGLVVIGGAVFTAQSLWYTAQSLDASRQAQWTAEQGQITDRYTKAVQQLGSDKIDIRLGGMYALERLAQDSSRDHQTVYDVLATFVREHDPKPSVELVPEPPSTDVQVALTIIGRRNVARDGTRPPNLDSIRISDANLRGADLRGISLTRAYVTYTNLVDAKLTGNNLDHINLDGSNLWGANLDNASLHIATLTNASLVRTRLRGASLNSADFTGSSLIDVDLRGAMLRDADFSTTHLYGVDLRGADLQGIHGKTEDEIRQRALVDKTTIF